ncbi:hypothetical protein Klosneuvirus_3_298 [Klosneuvirus KNV1]|uniref:Uncharacterized protein n=1 Tax=Klosneuvirus KNV1 TaxID=1977640 RepID=A0A1V0SKC9_9VIRU|nr:hypothetical protein Klosneuvirus_3_298 [Klosneuvirus KNV1]
MNEENNQCCAVIHGDKRCLNQTINHTNHCSEHLSIANKLYVNYKKICDTAYNLEIDKPISNPNEKFNYLYECYLWFNRAFHARLKHRRYAFVPECYDEGHNKQFTYILDKMNKCEVMLEEMHRLNEEIKQDRQQDRQQDQEEHLEEPPNKHNIIESIPETIKKNKVKRENNEKEENRLIDKYYNENKERLEKRDNLNYVCFNVIVSLLESVVDTDEINMFEITVLIHHLTLKLYRFGYFEEDYMPEKCKDCKCNNYVSYDERLACGCIFQNNTLDKYFNLMSDATIKKFCEIILLNKQKLLPLVGDLVSLYESYQEELLIKTRVRIKWSKKSSRLKLKPCLDPEPEKMSKIMARMRMKKKHYVEKFGNEYYSDDE